MLHIRVVTTPGLTGRLLDRLADLPGIRNLSVRELRGLSLDHDGAVTVEQVDASLASTAGAATAIGSRPARPLGAAVSPKRPG
jgi:hypothetical protein